MEIKFIDGYQITLVPNTGKIEDSSFRKYTKGGNHHKNKLWFVNIGGYDPSKLYELHEFGLFVAETCVEAKRLAKQKLLKGIIQQHNDDNSMLFSIDGYHSITSFQNWNIELIPDPESRSQKLVPDWFGFLRIDNYIQTELVL